MNWQHLQNDYYVLVSASGSEQVVAYVYKHQLSSMWKAVRLNRHIGDYLTKTAAIAAIVNMPDPKPKSAELPLDPWDKPQQT